MSDRTPIGQTGEQRPGTDSAPTTPSNQTGFISGLLLQALKWIAIILGVAIFVVIVVIVTLNQFDNRARDGRGRISISDEYVAQPPILEWYSSLGEVRGSTTDEETRTFLVVPHLGYDTGDRAVQNELIARNIQIKEIITFYFSSREAEQLTGVENRQRVKSDLTRHINRLMSNGKIRDVAFDQYQILDF